MGWSIWLAGDGVVVVNSGFRFGVLLCESPARVCMSIHVYMGSSQN